MPGEALQVRTIVTATLALALVGLTHAAAGTSANPSPQLQAKNAQAAQVLAQVDGLDRQFGALVDAWDGAKIQLAATEKQLAANRVQLHSALRESRIAQRHAAQLLLTIYENDSPDLIQLLAGSSRLSDVIDAVQYTHDVAATTRRVAAAAMRSKNRLLAAKAKLVSAERTRRATVAQLTSERSHIGAMLAERRRLLASVQSEVAQIRAREAAQQARAAAAARARLAAIVRAQAAAQAKAAAAAAARHKAVPPATTTTAPTPPTTTDVVAGTTTTTVAAAPPPAPAPTGGHPQAASVALQYIGVPYQWGGASPDTGFDCSGLVMYVYAQLGVTLPHFAAGQYGYGSPVARDQLHAGDLVFFDGLSHVGIYIGNGQMIHAPQTGDFVKISPLSDFGGRYVGARRI